MLKLCHGALQESLRQAAAEAVVRRYARVMRKLLNGKQREHLEGLAFTALAAGKTERETLEGLKREAR